MKLLVVATVLGVCSAARLDNAYLPPRGGDGSGFSSPYRPAGGASHSGAGFGQAAGGFGQSAGGFNHAAGGHSGSGFGGGATGYSGAGASGYAGAGAGGYSGAGAYNSRPQDANAQILRLNSEVTAEGFAYDFETSNGIRADAQGVATNGVQSQGSFSYKGDDGQEYAITYTADENGYRPQGAHLPTPPPIPEEILKSLEQNARDEAAGIVDDGSYHGEGAGAGAGGYGQQGYSSGPSYSGPQGPAKGYAAPSGPAPSAFGGPRGPKPSFGAGAASRQYLAPNAGGRGSGSFNPQTGYQY